ncbi:FAD-dependent oxidoreductase [Gallalistipes aquisgranensis]|uniref:FAD-dependent oxidoreductase n=1 Tax=Gallalistipes aquisgranensis TaxID=2779358 RepID=UPI001CF8335D|nr:FAD-dependent oxidoreductase [Gallalistipes aquisgranensis]MBE5032480.1 FAD-dependent oxidoreductase [Gallalistipes aquisgranensis]
MRFTILLNLFLLLSCAGSARPGYDLVIVGGTPGGIMAAIAAAREGKSSVILERTSHIGGLPVNGLGATDINTRAATTGLFREFVENVRRYYADKYGPDSQQVKDCSGGFHFEPSVAGRVFDRMLSGYRGRIDVFTLRQFDCDPANVEMEDDRILGVRVTDRATGRSETYRGRVFLDATYEGDLGAAAGVPFRVGREGRDEFGEPGAGRIYKYWSGPVAEGSDGMGDNAVQAYNYRLCLTDDPANRVRVEKPKNYNREEYLSLVEDVWTGRNTHVSFRKVTPEMMEENRRAIGAGGETGIPGDKWGIAKITNMVTLPNRKTDANNQHLALISTDLPEENWPWPTSSWEWRDRFAGRLRDYTLGLIWFAQNDEALPEHFREAASRWGLAADEYIDNGHFPRQVYVREGRRFEGVYFFTAKDALPVADGQRPPVHAESVTASHYSLDSHAVRKREKGRVHLDGFFGITDARVYTVPYGVMVPRQVDNLLLPVPVSGSHVGFSTLRMEPCWMALGQAAGIASSLAIDCGLKVRNVDVRRLQEKLIGQKATLIYYEDVTPEDDAFEMVQVLGLAGYLPGWEARLSEAVSRADLEAWRKRSRLALEAEAGRTPRGEVLEEIYRRGTEGRSARQ